MRQMKNSGIEWVGDIPNHWKIERMKDCIALREGGAWGEEETGDNDTICLRVADFDYDRFMFKNTSISALTKRHYRKSIVAKLRLLKGDIVIEKSGGGERTPVGRAVIFDKDYVALFANFMDRLRCGAFVYPKFMLYIFATFYKNQYTRNYIKQTTGIQNLDLSLMLNKEHVPMPPLSEQKAIAEFLDKKCGEVDALIADIQQEIETLEQYKRSVITEAVTKGLDPSVPMKDSGAGWMPTVPAHWLVEKIKYHLHLKTQKNMSDRQVLSLYRDYGIVPKDSRNDNHNVTSEDTSSYRFVRVGDFVVNKMKAWQGSVAVSQYEGIVSPAYFVYEFIDESFDKKYFHYLLRNKSYTTEFMRLSGGIRVGQWDLPAEAFENTLVLIPPIEEQQQIADYLDKKCKEIEGVIADKQSQIETLESYKKSLIFEYVTGKKEIIVQ